MRIDRLESPPSPPVHRSAASDMQLRKPEREEHWPARVEDTKAPNVSLEGAAACPSSNRRRLARDILIDYVIGHRTLSGGYRHTLPWLKWKEKPTLHLSTCTSTNTASSFHP